MLDHAGFGVQFAERAAGSAKHEGRRSQPETQIFKSVRPPGRPENSKIVISVEEKHNIGGSGFRASGVEDHSEGRKVSANEPKKS